MTKDWEAVQDEIRELSFVQKKPLEEIRELMEQKHNFRASTRAYRMKLKQWNYTRHKPRKTLTQRHEAREIDRSPGDRDSSEVGRPASIGESGQQVSHQYDNWEVIPGANTVADCMAIDLPTQTANLQLSNSTVLQALPEVSECVLDMLAAVLDNDTQKLEALIIEHAEHINDAIGLPFETPGARFFGHPSLSEMTILQHPRQRLLDIACAMPCGPMVWVLLAYGARGSEHPPGTDLALHNAIKNDRSYTVQALLIPGRSKVHGLPGATWKPLMQAVLWNVPDVVQILLNKGANIDDPCPSLDGKDTHCVLHLCLQNRSANYVGIESRRGSHQVLKLLLRAGESTLNGPIEQLYQPALEMFIEPWRDNPYWAAQLDPDECECFQLFVRNDTSLKVPFGGFPCGASTGNSFEHQAIWHSTPQFAKLLVDSVPSNTVKNGSRILHELLSSCPHANRHSADKLRDVEALLGKGICPNVMGSDGVSPLRRCIEQCPAVDVVPLSRLLLQHGADPEVEYNGGTALYVHAARAFRDSPLLDELMQTLLSGTRSYQGMRTVNSRHEWPDEIFPIPQCPTHEHVFASMRPDSEFAQCMRRNIPEDVHATFQRAYFIVISTRYLDHVTQMTTSRAPTTREKNQIFHIVGSRQEVAVPAYKFDQGLIMTLFSAGRLRDTTPDESPESTQEEQQQVVASSLDTMTPLTNGTTTPPVHVPFQFNPNTPARPPSPVPPPKPTDQRFPWHADDMVPSTTRIRWQDPCAKLRPGDLQRAADAVLIYRCAVCNNGTLLTKRERGRHDEEHAHTKVCVEPQCARRFCMGRRRKASAAGSQDRLFAI